eukprot:354241-Chlamydomonas_euryale.AAC.6
MNGQGGSNGGRWSTALPLVCTSVTLGSQWLWLLSIAKEVRCPGTYGQHCHTNGSNEVAWLA